jgi:hypothetical protein
LSSSEIFRMCCDAACFMSFARELPRVIVRYANRKHYSIYGVFRENMKYLALNLALLWIIYL